MPDGGVIGGNEADNALVQTSHEKDTITIEPSQLVVATTMIWIGEGVI